MSDRPSREPVYPVPMTASALAALRDEALQLAQLPFEAQSWIVLSPEGEWLKTNSQTAFKESWCLAEPSEVLNDAFEANGGGEGGGIVLLHNHLATGPASPSVQDVQAGESWRRYLTSGGWHLQDYLIVSSSGPGFSMRESMAAGTWGTTARPAAAEQPSFRPEPVREAAPLLTNWHIRVARDAELWRPYGGRRPW